MDRRRFEHLFVEVSLALGAQVPRYPLWLRLRELGWNPEQLGRDEAIGFLDSHLEAFLADHELALSARSTRRLRHRIARFDPSHPTPYERMERLGADNV